MKFRETSAAGFVVVLTIFMITISCGPAKKDEARRDSTVVDSVPASGENEFQQDVVPQSLPSQLDSVPDTVNRKP